MSRIRSIHPGQWTDEDFVACSAMARLLALGIRNEADDQGVFEWKPVTLKMRLLPADNVDVDELLAELVETKHIKRFEHDGKSFGAVRNFRKYQKPKKPNSVHVLPDELRTYVGLKGTESGTGEKAVGNQFGTGGGKPIQMEEGGGKRKRNPPLPPKGDDEDWILEKKLQFLDDMTNRPRQELETLLRTWEGQFGAENVIEAVDMASVSATTDPIPYALRTLQNKRRETRAGLARGAAPANHDSQWKQRLIGLRDQNFWLESWGPKPGEEGCQCPSAVLAEVDQRRAAE